jgi:peptide/nickel transport system ATP-binding protein
MGSMTVSTALHASNAAGDPVIVVDGLDVEIAVPAGVLHAVADVSFAVHAGETFCLVGESGCGKTMSALAILRLLPHGAIAKARHALFEGNNIFALSEAAMSHLRGNRIGMIFQDPLTALNPVYNIGTQLEEIYLRHRRATRSEARERALYLLDRVGIMAPLRRLNQFPHELSGGLRQRVMIAMMLMCEPALLIADEPTTALDVTVQVQILQLLANLQRESNLAILLITHNLGVVSRIADQVAVMYGGQIVETGAVDDIFKRPLHPYTRALLACVPARNGPEPAGIPGMVPSLVGPMTGCRFRNRCSLASSPCDEGLIPTTHLEPGARSYRCLRSAAELAVAASEQRAGALA